MRSSLALLVIGFLATGLFGSPFVHAHVDGHHHDGRVDEGIMVHAHLPSETPASDAALTLTAETGDHGEALHLFLLVTEKSVRWVGLVAGTGVAAAPPIPVVGMAPSPTIVRARDPASSRSPSRAPPAPHSV